LIVIDGLLKKQQDEQNMMMIELSPESEEIKNEIFNQYDHEPFLLLEAIMAIATELQQGLILMINDENRDN